METKPELNNLVMEGNNLQESPKKIKKTKPKILEEDIEIEKVKPKEFINQGTGAGGANTNYFGKKFEEKTDNGKRILEQGYEKIILNKKNKNSYYLYKNFEDKKIIYVSQSGLKEYMKQKHNLELFRCPDEAYIIEHNSGKKQILILEKKEQNVDGSVDTKLLSGPIFREEYEEALENKFEVVYAFCVSKFLQNKILSTEKKYIIFNKLMKKHNITILFGDDENYFETFDKWLNECIN